MEMLIAQGVLPSSSSILTGNCHNHRSSHISGSSHVSDSLILFGSGISSTTAVMKKWNREASEVRRVSCQSSGGSRRDHQKIVARTQNRRARHVKGVTPTKPQLLEELQREEDSDATLELFSVEGSGDISFEDDDEGTFAGDEALELEEVGVDEPVQEEGLEISDVSRQLPSTSVTDIDRRPLVSMPQGGQEVGSTVGKIQQERFRQPGTADSETQDRMEDFSNVAGDVSVKVSGVARQTAGEVADIARDTVEVSERNLREAGDEVADDLGDIQRDGFRRAGEFSDAVLDVSGEVSSVALDTAVEVGDIAQDTASQAGKDLEQTGETIRENVQDVGREATDLAQELSTVAVQTGQEVFGIARETADQSGKQLIEATDAAQVSLSEVGSQGEDLAREGMSALQNLAAAAGQRIERATDRVLKRTSESSEAVFNSLGRASQESAKTAEVIGKELFGVGEVLFDAGAEAIGISTTSSGLVETDESQRDGKDNPRNGKPAHRDSPREATQKDDLEITRKEAKDNQYVGLKVLVAGATGRTGRLVVEELVKKGVTVKALVRDVHKARNLKQLRDVEVLQCNIYDYESVKKTLANSNVVICAIGASSFPFDPFATYQTEYEGVLNLIAAAKNQGEVKKFVFVSSLGVTYLQLIPLLFWKKQAELYLQRSGLEYTIIRPGGLMDSSNRGESIMLRPADTQFRGRISRKKVAEVIVSSLIIPEASEKIVEVFYL